MYYEAFLAGIWASLGGTLGKLSGTVSVVGDGYLVQGILLVIMVMVNTWGCRYYLRSLDAATNSVGPTVISSSVSYVLSGLIGIFVFGETASMKWWLGTTLIITGLGLVAQPRTKEKHKE